MESSVVVPVPQKNMMQSITPKVGAKNMAMQLSASTDRLMVTACTLLNRSPKKNMMSAMVSPPAYWMVEIRPWSVVDVPK